MQKKWEICPKKIIIVLINKKNNNKFINKILVFIELN